MADTEQLEAVLAQWRDATAPLDAKARVDATFFALHSDRLTSRTTTTPALSDDARKSANSLVPHTTASVSGASNASAAAAADALEKSCRPWSHDDFLTRAATFSIATWFAKPAAISVFACARHGWINTSQPDELFCPCCEQYLCFQIDPKLSKQGALRVASAFAALLPSGHSLRCPWRDNPSPEAFATLPIASLEQVRASLIQRIELLLAVCARDRALLVAISALQFRAGVLERVLQQGDCSDHDASDAAAAALTRRVVSAFEHVAVVITAGDNAATLLHAAVLSACGWQLDAPSDGDSVALCETCNRRWRVSSYSSSSYSAPAVSATVRTETESDDTKANDDGVDGADSEGHERATKRQRTAAPLDPIAQHRWFCPWVSARKPEASRDVGVESDEIARFGENDARLWEFTLLPGWQQYAKALHSLGRAENALTQQQGGANSSSEMTDNATRPEQALESVRAVLGLPEW